MRLVLKAQPGLRVDLRGVLPERLLGLAVAEVERVEVGCGNRLVPLAELFALHADAFDVLRFEGDLSRCDRIGWKMNGGRIVVDGPVGHYAGGLMSAGSIDVRGDAGDLAACEMAGGTLAVGGDAGDFAASALPGGMDGMRGGTLVVKGDAGARFGDRMRRGNALVYGDAGDFVASRLVAGTIAIGGACGAHPCTGMRRGSVVFAGAVPQVAPTFVRVGADVGVFWRLLATSLARHGGPFAALASRAIERHVGDAAVAGKGELIVAR